MLKTPFTELIMTQEIHKKLCKCQYEFLLFYTDGRDSHIPSHRVARSRHRPSNLLTTPMASDKSSGSRI